MGAIRSTGKANRARGALLPERPIARGAFLPERPIAPMGRSYGTRRLLADA